MRYCIFSFIGTVAQLREEIKRNEEKEFAFKALALSRECDGYCKSCYYLDAGC